MSCFVAVGGRKTAPKQGRSMFELLDISISKWLTEKFIAVLIARLIEIE